MEKISQHRLLVSGESYEKCCRQVRKFFDLTQLVIYDCVEIIDEHSCSAEDAAFLPALEAAEKRNRESVRALVEELQQTGAQTIADLEGIEHGYPSKVLHVLSHLLDGFIGIDSYFYNLKDDSHWLPTTTAEAIRAEKKSFWLIHVDCYSASPDDASLLRM